MMTFEQAVCHRRSVYSLSGTSPIPDARIEEILHTALQCTPSAYNSQSPRAVLLLGTHHQKLWSIVMETLRKIVPQDKFGRTQSKIESFAAGYGTILFFEDTDVTDTLAKENPAYADVFPVWAMQHNGMLMCNVWTWLESEGLGASLQHYNPLIDDEVKAHWQLPTGWKLLAQMPFGAPTAAPGPKDKLPPEQRAKTFR